MSEYPNSRYNQVLSNHIGNQAKIKLLILDVDGVLTDGTKVYDTNHNPVYKSFKCKDFTAIKRFIASGVQVVMLSGDSWNEQMAKKRNIPFYCTRGKDLSLDKSKFIAQFEETYNVNQENMAFVGDDYFDLSMFKKLFWTFSPSDAPDIIKNNSLYVTKTCGGEGVVVEIYDFLCSRGFIEDASEDKVIELDKKEAASADMK
jgi:YrbI family 3-deoxy-D-manno-octulosonate 8-phosphate phosphatase